MQEYALETPCKTKFHATEEEIDRSSLLREIRLAAVDDARKEGVEGIITIPLGSEITIPVLKLILEFLRLPGGLASPRLGDRDRETWEKQHGFQLPVFVPEKIYVFPQDATSITELGATAAEEAWVNRVQWQLGGRGIQSLIRQAIRLDLHRMMQVIAMDVAIHKRWKTPALARAGRWRDRWRALWIYQWIYVLLVWVGAWGALVVFGMGTFAWAFFRSVLLTLGFGAFHNLFNPLLFSRRLIGLVLVVSSILVAGGRDRPFAPDNLEWWYLPFSDGGQDAVYFTGCFWDANMRIWVLLPLTFSACFRKWRNETGLAPFERMLSRYHRANPFAARDLRFPRGLDWGISPYEHDSNAGGTKVRHLRDASGVEFGEVTLRAVTSPYFYVIEIDGGIRRTQSSIMCSRDQPFLTKAGWKSASEMKKGEEICFFTTMGDIHRGWISTEERDETPLVTHPVWEYVPIHLISRYDLSSGRYPSGCDTCFKIVKQDFLPAVIMYNGFVLHQ